ncbi:MAG: c-type cytochrome [Vicinamibacterales bacterium]
MSAPGPRRARLGLLVLGLLAFGSLGAWVVYAKFFRQAPPPYFASDEEHFLYGSVGTEAEQGVPYWIWLVLPRIFPEYLPNPGGYASIGILGTDGHEMPIGLSKVTIGFPRVGINCAMCHAASFRARPDDVPTIYPAAASHQTGEQEYLRFLIRCAEDPRFTATTILHEIAKNVRLSPLDRLLYRVAIIPGTRRALLRLRDENAWMDQRPDWGRGRIDPFNPVKFSILRQPVDDTIGNADMMPLWNLARRDGTAYHWDGLNTSLVEVVRSSALGDGASRPWMDRDAAHWDDADPRTRSSLRRVMDYIGHLEAPAYPLPIDRSLAEAGARLFRANCATCHAPDGARTGQVVPLGEIGTDPHRLAMWTPEAASAYNAYGDGHPWTFSRFQKTSGYTATPLDGIWLTAPYLHNGSVPTLADLLEPEAARPTRFWRGYDVFDAERVGFVSTGPEAERAGTRYDVSRPGNANRGHRYGTTLTPDEKRALIEYLKTR